MKHIGRIIKDFAPKENNPRNSEGSFLALKDGGIIFFYSKFRGDDPGDASSADIVSTISYDGGESWSEDRVCFTLEDHDALNLMSGSALRFGNGDIGVFYLVRKGWGDMYLCLRRSSDEGENWEKPIQCTTFQGYHVVNNDRVIRLATGRIVFLSACIVPLDELPTHGWPDWPYGYHQMIYSFYSDDDGATWKSGAHPVVLNGTDFTYEKEPFLLQEPGVVELSNGVLMGWARTGLGRQYAFYSHDGGENWTPPEPSAFTGPCSPMSIRKNERTGELVAVWNPVSNYQTRKFNPFTLGRTPLVYAKSIDDGKTWSDPVVIESDENTGYCYTAIHFNKDSILLAYCAGEEGDKLCLSRLRIRKIAL